MNTAAKIVKSIFQRRTGQKPRFKKIWWLQEKILKHQDSHSEKTTKIGNLVVTYKRPYELLHTYREIFEREIYRFTCKSNAPFIVDCGANIGLSVLYYKMLYPNARIVAFEPDEDNFRLLQKNIRQNNLQDVVLRQEAVWISDGHISFSARGSEASHITNEALPEEQVRCVRLRNYLAQQADVDFLKMDIEGAEWEVIRDCTTQLSNIKNLFLEYHGTVNETDRLQEILQVLRDAGFLVYVKMAADLVLHPFVQKTSGLPYDVQLNLFCYKK